MRSERLEKPAGESAARLADVKHLAVASRLADDVRVRRDHERPSRRLPDREVGRRVPHIVEFFRPITLFEGVSLGGAFEIPNAVAGDDVVENAEVRGHRPGEGAVGGGRQHDLPARLAFRGDQRQDVLAIREGGGVDLAATGDLPLQCRAAFQQPERHQDEASRARPKHHAERFPEQVGRDQGAVEVHAEWNREILFESERRRHQRDTRVLLWSTP